MKTRRLHATPEALAERRRNVPVMVMVEPEFHARIKACCEQHDITMRELVEKAVDFAMRDPACVLARDPADGTVEDRLRSLEAARDPTDAVEDRLRSLEADVDVLKALLGPAVPR